MNRTTSPFRDPELVDMLADEPELLAFADALVETQQRPRRVARRKAAWRRRWAHVVAAAAVAAGAIGLLLAAPWSGSGSFVERALAAVGAGSVLHVVVTQPAFEGGPVIDISTGKTVVQTRRTEIWFDSHRDLKKTVETLDGRVVDEMLETPDGSWNQAGRVITCAWIAAHPIEATNLRVSCNASGVNGTTPRAVPEERPQRLDPALAGFVDHYRSALASGAAREVNRGTYGGHDVVWLEFGASGMTERVAVDEHTYKPVAVENGVLTLKVLTAETLGFSPDFFSKPPVVPAQRGSRASISQVLSPTAAASLLGGRALWLGRSWNGLTLLETTLQEQTIRFGVARKPEHAKVIRFTYVPTAASETSGARARVEIYESTSCVVNDGWTCRPGDPSNAGELKTLGSIGLFRSDRLYVSIWNFAVPQSSLDLARALIPLKG